MYTIKKIFEFCYAHRLHGYPGKCSNIHGHTAKVEVSCKVQELPKNGMAIDFQEMSKKIGAWLSENLDHRLILDKNDPIISKIKEAGENVVELETPPSAENLAKFIFGATEELGFPVSKVSFFESPTSVAKYKEKPCGTC
jgi:6-pyruvoyltetrahydropterin/6-carboxytetrahydropterin synthase